MPVRLIQTLVVIAMAGSIGVMLQPWWTEGFRVGFFMLLASTAAHIVVSHISPLATDN